MFKVCLRNPLNFFNDPKGPKYLLPYFGPLLNKEFLEVGFIKSDALYLCLFSTVKIMKVVLK
jgi:hypothetical protein